MTMEPRNNIYITTEQLREHYEIERELARRLRNSSRHERQYLYSLLYDELYQRVPYHSQLTRKSLPHETAAAVSEQMKFIKPFLDKEGAFLEIGSGDCSLSLEVSRFAKDVYAVDVSAEITRDLIFPKNFHLIISDGCNISVPKASIDVAFSDHLMEHVHPEDAIEQLKNIYNSLTAGGVYICITPNRLSGPHDISRYFDSVATGFHLKEYTTLELSKLFSRVGFSRLKVIVGAKGNYVRLPTFLMVLFEVLLGIFPYGLRKTIALHLPFRFLFRDVRLVGIK
jgi:SAM-dependent methyltransferase